MIQDGPSHGSIIPGGIEAISSGTAIIERARKAGLDVSHAGEVNDLEPFIKIRKSTLNEDSGLIGAAYLAFSKEK